MKEERDVRQSRFPTWPVISIALNLRLQRREFVAALSKWRNALSSNGLHLLVIWMSNYSLIEFELKRIGSGSKNRQSVSPSMLNARAISLPFPLLSSLCSFGFISDIVFDRPKNLYELANTYLNAHSIFQMLSTRPSTFYRSTDFWGRTISPAASVWGTLFILWMSPEFCSLCWLSESSLRCFPWKVWTINYDTSRTLHRPTDDSDSQSEPMLTKAVICVSSPLSLDSNSSLTLAVVRGRRPFNRPALST